jgi:hypothetical protein
MYVEEFIIVFKTHYATRGVVNFYYSAGVVAHDHRIGSRVIKIYQFTPWRDSTSAGRLHRATPPGLLLHCFHGDWCPISVIGTHWARDHNTCITIQVSQYMYHNTCITIHVIKIHVSQYMYHNTCITIHVS